MWDNILAINGDRNWVAMFEHPLMAPELVVTFTPRRVYVVM
jgi:hypothetical protein